jgi:putative transposase
MYNPYIHHRRSIRLKDFDYSRDGAFFVTMCTFDRGCYFEEHKQLRHIINDQWNKIPDRFPHVSLDEYVIMPNHFHGILVICDNVHCDFSEGGESTGNFTTLGGIVGSFKSLCSNSWLNIVKAENINVKGKFWQKNFYEHVIRNDNEMKRIRKYIAENPLKWELDRENPAFNKHLHQDHAEQWMV